MVTDSQRTNQEHPSDHQQNQETAAAVAPRLPKEDWDDKLTLPSGPLDWEQIIGQATATKGSETYVGVHPIETVDGRATTWAGPKASTEARARVPVEPPSGDPGTTVGETAEAETPDRPPIMEPAEERGGIIETDS